MDGVVEVSEAVISEPRGGEHAWLADRVVNVYCQGLIAVPSGGLDALTQPELVHWVQHISQRICGGNTAAEQTPEAGFGATTRACSHDCMQSWP